MFSVLSDALILLVQWAQAHEEILSKLLNNWLWLLFLPLKVISMNFNAFYK